MESVVAKGQNFETCPEGMHPAVIYSVYSVGTQHHEYTNSKGELKTWDCEDVYIGIEIDQRMTEGEYKGKRFRNSLVLGNSLSTGSKLRNFVEVIIGKQLTDEEVAQGKDITKLIGRTFEAVLQKLKSGYVNIVDYNTKHFDIKPESDPEEIPKRVKDLRAKAPEFSTMTDDFYSANEFNDSNTDVPF